MNNNQKLRHSHPEATASGLFTEVNVFTKEDFKKLNLKIAEADKAANDLHKLRDMMRKQCTHDWEYQCTGHNSSYYTCRICGEEKEE